MGIKPEDIQRAIAGGNKVLAKALPAATAGEGPHSGSEGHDFFKGPDRRRIRQSSKPLLNKLEQEWLMQLEAMFPECCIYKQALRWRLGNGIFYKPDFAAFVDRDKLPHKLTCWEVKGPFAHRGGFENLKVAASRYPEVRWMLVWKRPNGGWVQQEVLP